MVGVVDGGAYGRHFLVEGVDVAFLTCLPDLLQGKPEIWSSGSDGGCAALRRIPSWGHRLGGGLWSEGHVVCEGVRLCA